MIWGIILCIPILLQIKKDKNIYRLFLCISIVTAIIIPTIDSVTSTEIIGYIAREKINIHIGMGYVLFFIFGDILRRVRFSRIQLLSIVLIGIISKYLMVYSGNGIGDFDLRQVLFSIAWYVSLLYIGRKIKRDGKLSLVLRFGSKQCFVVYLVHAAVIVYLQRIKIDNEVSIMLLTTAISCFLAIVINTILNRIKRYIQV